MLHAVLESRPSPKSTLFVPTLAEARQRLLTLEAEVEPRFIDEMGHMNVAWYVHLFDRATWSFLAALGIDSAYMRSTVSGMFAVDQHTRYFAELRLGDRVAVHTKLLEVRDKSIRFTHVMIDVGRERIASTTEFVGAHVDMTLRRGRPFPEALRARLERVAAEG